VSSAGILGSNPATTEGICVENADLQEMPIIFSSGKSFFSIF
jgi:hypothetical protein